ncbi:conjugal transfer pilus assembly protein TraW [Sphingobium sp. AP50]|uniref:conjugal transfer protein TraW n=1 Tax=Sphingobium sp. AP50 TaxID=1884369 RepID=UPI0008BA0608|nr:conjugal transfer protein TraW [Sphingobium sp. AP50]SEJ92287.1 conjugal transfer pilus assembly protein TraW [Sphingobium sp. AP50]
MMAKKFWSSRQIWRSLAIAAVSSASLAHAATATIGRTWPIAEPDAMAEIEARAARQPANIAAHFGPRAKWTAMRAATLGTATQARTRSVVPFYTLDFDIALPDGTMLYPKGYTFNPLTYVSLPQRLVIVHPQDLAWAIRSADPSDFILLTAGDALSLGEKVGRPLFILEERVKDRLGLTVAPVIVTQAGQRLLLTEVPPARALRKVTR